MKKLYEYRELPEKAKKKAVGKVFDIERELEQDWSFESENITENISYYLEEAKLEFGEIYWDTNYGVNVDLDSVKMTDEFLQKILSEEDYKKYEDLNEISSGYLTHELFDKDYERKGYVMNFDYSNFDELETMKFVLAYEDDEEIKAKFRFPLLLEEELTMDVYEELVHYASTICMSMAAELGSQVNGAIGVIYTSIIKMVRDGCDYMGSEEYYRDSLDGGGYEADAYLFNFSGEAIMKDDKYVDNDFEGQYMLKAS